jgi:pyruvate formate lyase activating enzyme
MTADALISQVCRDRIFFEHSGGGVTISGGEPLAQPAFTIELLRRCRREGIHTAVETCGLGNASAVGQVGRLADLILFDLKLLDDTRHRAATGRGNRTILENLRSLADQRAPVVIRIPLVPAVTDDEENIVGIARWLREAGLSRVELLPFHRAGLAKYPRVSRTCPLAETLPPSAARVSQVLSWMRPFGLFVTVGGAG